MSTSDHLFDRQRILSGIILRLSVMETCLKWHSSRGENDICKTAEDVVARFLGALCGWNLINLNTIYKNYPAADIGDPDQYLAIQVTVNGTPQKVRDTHDRARDHCLAAAFDKLIILFLLPAAPADPGKRSGFIPCPDIVIEKWARPQIDHLLNTADTDTLGKVLAVLDKEMSAISAILQPFQKHVPQNLPYLTLGSLFKGRDTFLSDLRKSLTQQTPAVIRNTRAIHGMGGVGKTRAAVEYAWAHEHDYSALLFVTADSPDSLQQNLAALCGPLVLNLPERDATDIRVQLHAVLQWLQQHPGWFLIIDNVDTPDAQRAVTALIAQLPAGHVVITSRLADWPAGVTALDLDVLSLESSIAFLLERTHDRRIRHDADPDTARTIAQHLDCLALALEQSAAYIRARRCSLADYLRDWESRRAHVLTWHDAEKSHYPRSIAITYDTSLALLSDHARRLFLILSWLAPDPMPCEHLEKIEDLPDPRALLVDLSDLHLATFSADGTTFSVHRLLQDITRQQQESPMDCGSPLPLSEGAGGPGRGAGGTPGPESVPDAPAPRSAAMPKRQRAAAVQSPPVPAVPPALLTALSWVNAAMPGGTDDVRTWPVAVPLLPHALTLANTAAQRDLPTPTTRLLTCAALLLETQANYPAVEPHYRRALALDEKHLGENHAETATSLNNLATFLQATNRLAEAEPLMRRALAIDAASFGPDHPKIAYRLNNLARLLQDTDRREEAEPMMARALRIFEDSLGSEHPNSVTVRKSLAILRKEMGLGGAALRCFGEAEPMLARALGMFEDSLGGVHPYSARVREHFAVFREGLTWTDRAGAIPR